MIDARRTRSSFAFGLAAVGATTAAYALVFVAGCGSGQEAPPNTAAQAQAESVAPEQRGPGRRRRHLPPPAAFEACKDKAIGAACTVELNDNDINGKCEAPPPGASQSTPACRPEGSRRHGPRGAPPEIVFAACDGKASGDACTVTFERGTIQGSCMAPRRDAGSERLLCAPAHRQGRESATDGGGK